MSVKKTSGLVLVCLLLAARSAQAHVCYAILAKSATSDSLGPPGVPRFAALDVRDLNQDGEVLLAATPGALADVRLIVTRPDELRTYLNIQSCPIGAGGGEFISGTAGGFRGGSLTQDTVAFHARVSGTPDPLNHGLWIVKRLDLAAAVAAGCVDAQGNSSNRCDCVQVDGEWFLLQKVAAMGDTAPGTTATFADLGRDLGFATPWINARGTVAFVADLTRRDTTQSPQDGIWTGTPGNLRAVAIRGQAVPDVVPPSTFETFYSGITLNDQDQIGFAALFPNPGGNPFALAGGWWLSDSSGLHLIARTGQQAPGAPAGVLFGAPPGPPSLNNAGQVAFTHSLAGDATGQNDEAIFAGSVGNLRLVAREGMTAPGVNLPFRQFFAGSGLMPSLNGRGDVAFFAKVGGVTSQDPDGIWAERNGQLQKVVSEGDTAPGLPSGTTFTEVNLNSPYFNYYGQVAFFAVLEGPEPTGRINSWWIAKSSGELTLIARQGADLPGGLLGGPINNMIAASGPIRLGSGGEQGWPTPFNDLGHLVFTATVIPTGGTLLQSFGAAIVAELPDDERHLRIKRVGAKADLCWVCDPATLETSPEVTGAAWSNAPDQKRHQIIETAEPRRFYRLRYSEP